VTTQTPLVVPTIDGKRFRARGKSLVERKFDRYEARLERNHLDGKFTDERESGQEGSYFVLVEQIFSVRH
jgi:hypothetical protein